MDGRAFLRVAGELAGGPTETHWRAAAGRACYALMLECRDALSRWGFPARKQNGHSFVRLCFTYTNDADVKHIGRALDMAVRMRNLADYQLANSGLFATDYESLQLVADCRTAIALFDVIEADAARRAAAIAAIRPPP